MSAARIGVLIGGSTDPHAATGDAIVAALAEVGQAAVTVPLGPGVDPVRAIEAAQIDAAFIALEGRFGEEGSVQGLLEVLGIPYTGSSPMSSALAMDKLKSKELFRLHNVPTPPYYTLEGRGALAELGDIHGSFGLPVVVKPRREGSGGVSKVTTASELFPAVERAMAHDGSVLVERFIAAREVHVVMLEGRVLGGVEVVPSSGLYDVEARRVPGSTELHDPPRLAPIRYRGVLNLAERASQALDTSGPVRVDLLVTEGQNEYVLDVNTLPSLAPGALLPEMAAKAGYSYPELCAAIAAGARLHTASASTRIATVARHAGARVTARVA
jgi:D-alanine-D-alanine ligase